MSELTWAGIMTTASNVLFSGSGEGHFFALDARTGNLLWKTQLGSVVRSIDSRDVFEGVDGGITVAERSIGETEVVPRSRILGLLACRVEQRVAAFSEALRLDRSSTDCSSALCAAAAQSAVSRMISRDAR